MLRVKTSGENKCLKFKKTISAYSDNEADIFENEAVTEHIAGCPNCKREVANLYVIKGMIKSVYAPKENVDFSASVMGRINSRCKSFYEKKEDRSSFSKIVKYSAVAAVVFLALGITILYSQNQTKKMLAEKRKFDTYVVEHSTQIADENEVSQVISVSFEK